MVTSLKNFFQQRFDAFLKKRVPSQAKQQLTNRNIFIFPSAFGFGYMFFIVLLFLLGTNYQNNIILLLSFLLASFFIVAMLHSFFNLAGLKIEASEKSYGYCGTSVDIKMKIISDKARYDYFFQFPEQRVLHVDDIIDGENFINVPFIATQRGLWQLGRLKISSYFGFGLFVTWSQVDLALTATIYPKPLTFDLKKIVNAELGASNIQSANQQINLHQKGVDEFYELTSYRQGESLAHVAWKQVAKGQGWYSKQYRQEERNEHALTLNAMPANQLEDKLRQLSFVLAEFNQLSISYSLDLNNTVIPANSGEKHYKHCLNELAGFGFSEALPLTRIKVNSQNV